MYFVTIVSITSCDPWIFIFCVLFQRKRPEFNFYWFRRSAFFCFELFLGNFVRMGLRSGNVFYH